MQKRHVIRLAALVAGAAVIGVLHHNNVFEALAAAQPNTVMFDSGFEDATWDGWQRDGEGASALDTTCAHSGARGARLEIQRDGPGRSWRSELVPISVRGHYRGSYARFHEEYWYRFSIFLAKDWDVDTPESPESIVQWHDLPDRMLFEEYRNPPLAIVLRGSRMLIESRWDASLVSRPDHYDGQCAVDVGDVHDCIGRWCEWTFCVRWEWSKDGGGCVRVWRDNVLLVDRDGPNCFHDLRGGPYLKLGPYKWPWKGGHGTPEAAPPGPVTARVMWVDDVSITRGR